MTHSYYQWSVSSPDPAPTVDSPSYRFNLSPGATNAATAPVSTSTGNLSAETGVVWIQFMTPSSNNVPGTAHSGGWPGVATWPTGTYDILYNITSAGANMQMGAQTIGTVTGHFARTNQAGTSHVATVAADSAVQTGTGLKTTSISSWSPSGSTWDDRFEVLLVAYRDDPGGHGNETAIIETNDPDADSTIGGIARGPWSTTPPALTGNISRVGTPTWVEKTDATSGDPAVVSAYPTGVQADDYILAVVIHSDGTNPTITAPAGFTSVGSSNDGNSKLEVFEYFYVGSGDPSLSFYGSVTNDTTVLVVAYRGVSTTDTRYGLTTQTAATPGSLLSITKDAGDRAGIAFLGQGVDPSIQQILPPAFKYTSGDPQPNTLLFPDESNLRRERDTAPITTPSIIQAQDFDFASGAGTHRIWSDLGEASVLHGVFFLIQEAAGGSATAEPASTTVAVTLPQAARTAGSTLTPAPVAAGPQFAVPTPTRSGGASRSPDAVAANITLPQATPVTASITTVEPEPVAVGTSTPQTSVLTTELQLSGFALTATYTEAAATVVNPAPVTVAATLPQVTVVAQASATTTPDPITAATTVPQAVRSGGAVRTPDPVAAATSLPQAAPVASASRTPDAVAVAVTVPQAVRSGSTSLAVEPVSVAVAIPQVTITSVTNVTRTPEPVSVGVSLPSATVLAAASRTVEPVAVAVAVPQAVRSGSTSQSPASVAVAVASPQATPTGAASRTVEPVSVAVAVPQAVRQGGAVRTPDPVAAAISVPQVTLVTVTDATVTPDPLLVALVFPEAATSITEIPETPTVAVALPQVGRSGSTDRSPTPITVSLAVPQATTTSTALKTIEPIAVSVSLPLASVSLFEPAPTEPTTVGISLPQLTRSAGASREAITSVSVALPQHTWQGDALVTSRSTGEFDTGFDFGFNTSHSLIASVGVFFPQVSVVGTKSITVTPDPVAVATSLPLAAALVDATVVLAPVAVAGSLPQAVFQGTALRTTVPVSVLVASPQATPSVAFPFSLYATGDGTTADVVNELDTTTNLWQSVDDDPLSPNDADWINNTKVTASQFFDLTDVPGDFESFDRMTMKVRWNGQLHSSDIALYVQLFESDETSSLSDEMLVATATGDTAFANTSDISFTGLDTVSDKTVWDGARIRFRWGAV